MTVKYEGIPFDLGDEVECIITEFTGVVIGIGKFIGEPDQALVKGLSRGGKVGDSAWISIKLLRLVMAQSVVIK